MPIEWHIDHADRLVRATGRDPITLDDFIAYFRALSEAGAMGYGKLVDLSYSDPELRAADIRAMAAHINGRASAGDDVLGPVAIIVDSEITSDMVQLFESRSSAANRPLRVFDRLDEGRQWLDSMRLPGLPGGATARELGR